MGTILQEAIAAAPTCEAKLRSFDRASEKVPPYCRRKVALGSFIDRQGIRRYHCQAEGHKAKVVQLHGEARFDPPPGCYFCHRTAPILDGTYTAIDFGPRVGIQHVCDDCNEKADER